MNKQDEAYSLSIFEANWKSLLIVFPAAVLCVFAYTVAWSWEKTVSDFLVIYSHYGIALSLLLAGIFAHELLHGLIWMASGQLGWNAIKYGFKLSALTPYAHCKEPISAKAYRRGVVAPGLILGILPFIASLWLGNAGLLGFGFIFTLAAGGDFLMLWIIKDIPEDSLVKDHPERVGCKTVSTS